MKKIFLMMAGAAFFFACTGDETTGVEEEKSEKSVLNAKAAAIDYEINDCKYEIRGAIDQAYELTVLSTPTMPDFYGGPITTSVNFPKCQNLYSSSNTASVQPIINIHFELANYRPDRCIIHDAYFEISQTAISPNLPYGNINKIYPLTSVTSMDLKFNMNYILQCNNPVSDPTGPNDPYPVYNPYSIPFNLQYSAFPYPTSTPPALYWYNYIFGSKHFYYRIIIKTRNECTGRDCLTVTKWNEFEWTL